MKSKTLIVFNQPYGNLGMNNIPETAVFENSIELMDFLRSLDFSRAHIAGRDFIQYPKFRLGTKTVAYENGVRIESIVRWGPRFVFSDNVNIAGNGDVIASVMRDTPRRDNKNRVVPELCNVKLCRGSYDAVIQTGDKLKQIWPRVENSRGELMRFITRFSREREQLKNAR